MWQIALYLFHFISENEIIYILMYFTETRQLGLEPESARKDKQTSNKISNKLPVRALNKLLKTQAGDISPYVYENSLWLRVYNIKATFSRHCRDTSKIS